MTENSTSNVLPALSAREPSAAALTAIGIAAPIVLERRYRLLIDALVRLHRSRRGRWSVAVRVRRITMAALALLAARHFATSPWPLSGGPTRRAGSRLLVAASRSGLQGVGMGAAVSRQMSGLGRSRLRPANGAPP